MDYFNINPLVSDYKNPPQFYKIAGTKGVWGCPDENGNYSGGCCCPEHLRGEKVDGKNHSPKWWQYTETANGTYKYDCTIGTTVFYKKGNWVLQVNPRTHPLCKDYVTYHPNFLAAGKDSDDKLLVFIKDKGEHPWAPHTYSLLASGGEAQKNWPDNKLTSDPSEPTVDYSDDIATVFPGPSMAPIDKFVEDLTNGNWFGTNAPKLLEPSTEDGKSFLDKAIAKSGETGKLVFISKSVFPQSMQENWPTV